ALWPGGGNRAGQDLHEIGGTLARFRRRQISTLLQTVVVQPQRPRGPIDSVRTRQFRGLTPECLWSSAARAVPLSPLLDLPLRSGKRGGEVAVCAVAPQPSSPQKLSPPSTARRSAGPLVPATAHHNVDGNSGQTALPKGHHRMERLLREPRLPVDKSLE